MKKYELILMVGIFCFGACSQKDESPKVTKKETIKKEEIKKIVSQVSTENNDTLSNKHRSKIIIENKQIVLNETLSKSYIESIEDELNKIKEEDTIPPLPLSSPSPLPLVSNYEEEPVSVPDHIKNSTITSVPH